MVRIPAAHLSSASLFLSTANHPDPVQHKHISTHYSQDTTHLHHLPPQIQLAHNLSLYATDLALTPPPVRLPFFFPNPKSKMKTRMKEEGRKTEEEKEDEG